MHCESRTPRRASEGNWRGVPKKKSRRKLHRLAEFLCDLCVLSRLKRSRSLVPKGVMWSAVAESTEGFAKVDAATTLACTARCMEIRRCLSPQPRLRRKPKRQRRRLCCRTPYSARCAYRLIGFHRRRSIVLVRVLVFVIDLFFSFPSPRRQGH